MSTVQLIKSLSEHAILILRLQDVRARTTHLILDHIRWQRMVWQSLMPALMGPMDLCALSLPVWSLTRSFSTKWGSSIPVILSLTSRNWDSQGAVLAVKIEAEKVFNNPTFSVSSFTRAPTSFSSGPRLSLVLLCMAFGFDFLFGVLIHWAFELCWVII